MGELDLSQDERTLFVELGFHTARVMWLNIGQSDPTFKTPMYDTVEAVYEQSCDILHDLGVFASIDIGCYRFVMPLDEVRGYLQGPDLTTTYSFEEMIGCFLSAVDFQGDISAEKAPFDVHGPLQQAMWACVKLDFATREPEGFRWGDKIKPMMIAGSLWSQDGECYQTLREQEENAFAEEMWNALPKWRRHILARWISGKDEVDVYHYLFRRWDGKRYSLFGKPPKIPWYSQSKHDVFAMRYIVQKLLEIRRSHPF